MHKRARAHHVDANLETRGTIQGTNGLAPGAAHTFPDQQQVTCLFFSWKRAGSKDAESPGRSTT